tara:strand:- start:410 stop:1021 length:612 start_codon:yes stop_codon:yes gene_type:complete
MDSKDLRNIAEAYTLTKADKTGNTPAWQNRDKKNPKTGEPIYTKADHLKKEELEATGVFSTEEIDGLIDENRRAARAAGGFVDDSPKQTDPSKDGFTGISDNIATIMKQNAAMKKAAAAKKTKKEELELTGKFTAEEIDAILEAERSIADRLERKRKLYDKTTKKAMQYARDEGEAAGHARYRMSSISREYDALKAKRDKKEK